MVNSYIQKWYRGVCRVKNAKDREVQHSSWPCSSFSFFAVCNSLVKHRFPLPCFRWRVAYRTRSNPMFILPHSSRHITVLHLIKKKSIFMRFDSIWCPWASHREQLCLRTLLWRKGHLGKEAGHSQGWHCDHGRHRWVPNLWCRWWILRSRQYFIMFCLFTA